MAEETFDQHPERENTPQRNIPVEPPPKPQISQPSQPGTEPPRVPPPSAGGDRRGDENGDRSRPQNQQNQEDQGAAQPQQQSSSQGQGGQGGRGRSPRQPRQRRERRERPQGDRRQDRPGTQDDRGQQRDVRQQDQNQSQDDRRRRGRGERRQAPQSGRGGKDLSVVIPLYNEESSLRELYDGLRDALSRFPRHELIFVDDGSTDGSARVLHEIRSRDRSRIKVIRFRRNYGKSAALSVGFAEATGEVVVTMDADLQDDPAEIPSLVNEIRKGFDLVSGWKRKRFDPITKTIPSRFFNFVTSVMTGIPLHDFNCGLKAYRREVVKEINVYGELHRYIPVLAHWRGFKIGEVVVRHRRRKYGKTKFGIGRFWKGFLDLLTVLFTTRYLRKPMHLFGFWGMMFFLAGFAIDLYLVILWFTQNQPLSNRPLFLGGILLIIVGVQFVSIGLLGELISKSDSDDDGKYSIREMLN